MNDKNCADWSLWAEMQDAELWQAVALSLDFEPSRLPGYEPRPISGGPFDDCPEEFKRRLAIARSHISSLEITGLAMGSEMRTRITMVSLRTWAATLRQPWDFPDGFPAARVNEGQSERSRGRKLKKEILVSELRPRWPAIDRDIKDASSNGLAKAARAEKGYYYEGDALAWAESHGKLRSIAALGSFVNRLKG